MKRLLLMMTLCLLSGIVPGGVQTAWAQFSISGTVTGTAAAPVDGVEIRLFTGTGIAIGIPLTYTDAAGNYVVAGIPSGGYILQFRPPVATKLVATELPATVAGTNLVLNAPLAAGHLLFGFVRDDVGVGIGSIDLQARSRDTGDMMLTPGDDTDATGFYDVVLPTGEYDLEWRAVAPGSLPWIPFAERLSVEADTQFDVVLQLGNPVSGLITDGLGTPLANINLDFINEATGVKALTPGDNTLLDGTYVAQVPLGTYTVIAKPLSATGLLPASVSGVVVDGAVAGINFTLGSGLLLSGTVSGSAGVLEGVDLDITDATTGVDILAPFDVTNALGQYSIVVPVGSYNVDFTPPVGSLDAPQTAVGVSVVANTILNMVLPPGVEFSGTVTSGGAPVPGTDIDMKDQLTGLSIPLNGDNTDAFGAFTVVVVPGTYILEIEPPLAAGLVAQRTTNFSVVGTMNLPISLVPGSLVTGTVTTAQGLPLGGVNVDALRTSDGVEVFTPGDHTNATGFYNMIVPNENYAFRFKLGAAYAVPDSVFVGGVVISADAVVDAAFPGGLSSVEDETPSAVRSGFAVSPNPFNPSTVVAFDLPVEGRVRLSVHSLDGRRVAVLADGLMASGSYSIPWHGRDDRGRVLPSGVYLVALSRNGETQSSKISLVK